MRHGHSCLPWYRRLLARLLRRRHSTCMCTMLGVGGVTVHGEGSEQDPYVIGLRPISQ
jgi:hypothetical protein